MVSVFGCQPHPFFNNMVAREVDKNIPLQIVILGEPRTGKTAFIRRYTTCHYYREEQYTPTMGIETTQTHIWINSRGKITRIKVILHEVGNLVTNDDFAEIMKKSNIALVFFNTNLRGGVADINRMLGYCDSYSIPTLLVASRCDEKLKNGSPGDRLLANYIWKQPPHLPPRMGMEMSSLSCYNLDRPILWAARKWYGDRDLVGADIPIPETHKL